MEPLEALFLAAIASIAITPSAFAISDYQSGFEHGMNDAATVCNHPDGCHWYILKPGSNQTGKFTNGYFDGFCAIRPNTNQPTYTFTCPPPYAPIQIFMIKGYWTARDGPVPQGMKKYHIFLNGTYPSSTNRSTKLTNEGLSVCVQFTDDWEPAVCHPIKESEIPLTNNSIVDAGFFIIPINSTNPGVYAKVKYEGIMIGEALEGHVHYLDMNYLVYPEVSTVKQCIEYYHFKLNSEKFNECYRALG